MRDGRLVILGNGGAALSAVQAARQAGHRGEIHLVSDSEGPAFNPMLSPYYFKGRMEWNACHPFGPGFYRDHDVTGHFGAPVVALDADTRRIALADGARLDYDACLIATGAAAVVPPIPGLRGSRRVFTLRSAASARRLEEPMRTARRALVIGVSLVGMKVAEILAKHGIAVVLLGRGDRVLPRGSHPSAAALLRRHVERHGIDVRLGCTLERLDETVDSAHCHLTGGAIETVDLVVVCTGVRPCLDFVDRARVTVDVGVVTDAGLRASAEGLYAAGDACQAFNRMTGRHDWLGTWGTACRQGRVAGHRMAGRDAVFPGAMSEHISPLFDWTYAHVGEVQFDGEAARHVAAGDPERGGYALVAVRDGIVTGANLINCTHLAGQFKTEILRKPHGDERLFRGADAPLPASAEALLDACRSPQIRQPNARR